MLSISNPISGDRGGYYVNLAAEDYYKTEEAGEWFGKAASELKLSGRVDGERFRHLLNGYDESGKVPLVQNAGKATRQQGWDLTFSAPKDLSVLWALSDKPVRDEIEAAHKKAVESALSEIEEIAGVTRRGKGGAKKEKTKLVFARFEHFTSRALDPQIHTHAVLLNLCVRKDRTTGSIQSRNVFEQKMRGGEKYRTALAEELRQRLGLEVVQKDRSLRIPIVPQGLSDAFSRRRKEILRELKSRKEVGAVAAKKAALRTRQKKERVSPSELFSAWKKVAEDFQFQSPVHTESQKDQARTRNETTEEPKARIEASNHKKKDREKSNSASMLRSGSKKGNGLVRIESRFVFPSAPDLSSASRVTLPRVVVGYPKKKWGTIRSKRDFLFVKVLVQERKLFPSAPKWSPVSKIRVPVIRIKPKSLIDDWRTKNRIRNWARRTENARQTDHTKESGRNKGQSNSNSQ